MVIFSTCIMNRWKTCDLDRPYHVPWRGGHAKWFVKSFGYQEKPDGSLGNYPDAFGDTKVERLLDVDWSSNFGLFGYTNPKNNGYWDESRKEFEDKNFLYVIHIMCI